MHEQIVACKAQLVAISPQLPKYSKQVVKKHHLGFPILSDFNNTVAERFGLTFTLPERLQAIYTDLGLDLPRFNGTESWQLPIPGRFMTDKKGIIRMVEAHPDYTRRPEPSAIIDYLQSLN